MKKLITICLALCLLTLILSCRAKQIQAKQIIVSTSTQLNTAINNANPGDEIVVQDGTYDGPFNFSCSGNDSLPIIIRTQNIGGATIVSDSLSTIPGNYVHIIGFIFNTRGIQINGDHNRINRNLFHSGNSQAIYLRAASYNLIDYNEITNWNGFGIQLRAPAPGMYGNTIRYNYIHDNTKISSQEAIQLGTDCNSTGIYLGTLVEYNYFENIDTDEEDEIISVKSSGNTIYANTFKKSTDKTCTLRHGWENTVKNNTFIDIDLIVLGEDHQIIGNHFIGQTRTTNLNLRDGSCTQDEVKNCTGCLPWARYCMIAKNIVENGKIIIKDQESIGNILAENTAQIDDNGTGTIYQDTYNGDAGEPVLLTPSMVGPDAGENPSPSPSPSPNLNPSPSPLPGLSWEAEDGQITSPFQVSNGLVYQTSDIYDPSNSGKAVYSFNLAQAGDYLVKTVVNATDLDSDSFYVNIDAEPTDPYMIWDVDLTNGLEERTVSWRGNGSFGDSDFKPKIFTLTAGDHQLIIRGREANTQLDKLSILAYQPGDVNGDETINHLDMLMLISNWLGTSPDIDSNSKINSLDIGWVIKNWQAY